MTVDASAGRGSISPTASSSFATHLRSIVHPICSERKVIMAKLSWLGKAAMAAVAGTVIVAVTAPSASAAKAGPIDFLDITTWSYDKLAPEIYEGNLTKPSELTVYVKTWSRGEEVYGTGCDTSITVSGYFGLVGDRKTSVYCSVANPGVMVKVPFDGKYLITVSVTKPGDAPFVATKEIFVGPFAAVPAVIDTGSAAVGLPSGSSTTGSTG
jgi:hypothetical protein